MPIERAESHDNLKLSVNDIYQWWGQGGKSWKPLSKLDQNTLVESLKSYSPDTWF